MTNAPVLPCQPSTTEAFDDLSKLEKALAQRDANADHARLANANLKLCQESLTRLTERCEQYKGQVKAGSDEIDALKGAVDVLESNARVQAKLLADTARRVEELEGLGQFLVDRLEEFDPGDDEPEREYHGHVAPALSRFRSALSPDGKNGVRK